MTAAGFALAMLLPIAQAQTPAAVGTNAESRSYRYTPTTPGSQETADVAGRTIVLSAGKAF
jgi:hypothetical protein